MKFADGRNWLHLDLKGAIPSCRKMKEQLAYFKDCGFNGIVWEYDDRIPWKSWNNTWRQGYNWRSCGNCITPAGNWSWKSSR